MSASVSREFVGLESATSHVSGAGGHPCQGLYWTPSGVRPKLAFIANHYNGDFSEHYLAPHVARLGCGFLGWNTRFRGNEGFFLLEHALVDIGAAALVVQSNSDSGIFPSDAKAIYEALASGDKTLEMIAGDHYLESPANARDDVADLIVAWLQAHGI